MRIEEEYRMGHLFQGVRKARPSASDAKDNGGVICLGRSGLWPVVSTI